MVARVVLVGLGYRQSGTHALPGVVLDLYRMYRYADRVMGAEDIYVVTDITREENVKNLIDVLLSKQSGADILKFFQTVRRLVPWTAQNNLEPCDLFSRLCEGATRVMWYFTGHGKDGCMVLPDGSLEPMSNILDAVRLAMMRSPSPEPRELLWISDCCHGSDLGLPFLLRESASPSWDLDPSVEPEYLGRLSRFARDPRDDPGAFFSVRVIALSSSTRTSSSTTSLGGSDFTRRVCEGLYERLALHSLILHAADEEAPPRALWFLLSDTPQPEGETTYKGVDDSGVEFVGGMFGARLREPPVTRGEGPNRYVRSLDEREEELARAVRSAVVEFRASFLSASEVFPWVVRGRVSRGPWGTLRVAVDPGSRDENRSQ